MVSLPEQFQSTTSLVTRLMISREMLQGKGNHALKILQIQHLESITTIRPLKRNSLEKLKYYSARHQGIAMCSVPETHFERGRWNEEINNLSPKASRTIELFYNTILPHTRTRRTDKHLQFKGKSLLDIPHLVTSLFRRYQLITTAILIQL